MRRSTFGYSRKRQKEMAARCATPHNGDDERMMMPARLCRLSRRRHAGPRGFKKGDVAATPLSSPRLARCDKPREAARFFERRLASTPSAAARRRLGFQRRRPFACSVRSAIQRSAPSSGQSLKHTHARPFTTRRRRSLQQRRRSGRCRLTPRAGHISPRTLNATAYHTTVNEVRAATAGADSRHQYTTSAPASFAQRARLLCRQMGNDAILRRHFPIDKPARRRAFLTPGRDTGHHCHERGRYEAHHHRARYSSRNARSRRLITMRSGCAGSRKRYGWQGT